LKKKWIQNSFEISPIVKDRDSVEAGVTGALWQKKKKLTVEKTKLSPVHAS
jgi:hypothetical protein